MCPTWMLKAFLEYDDLKCKGNIFASGAAFLLEFSSSVCSADRYAYIFATGQVLLLIKLQHCHNTI